METADTTARDRLDDEAIVGFLSREADRRAGNQAPSAELVATIRGRRRREWPRWALASGLGAVIVGIVVIAVALARAPSGNISSSAPPAVTGSSGLPAVAPGEACPVSEPTRSSPDEPMLLGDGPVRLRLAHSAASVYFERSAIDVLWTVEPGFRGDVVVRGGRLDGASELGFGDPAAPVRELRLEAREPAPIIGGRALLASTPMRLPGAGCYGIEIDAGGRSSIIVFEARPVEDAFAQLDRPLQLPPAGSGTCPLTAATGSVPFLGLALGDGPVYLAGEGTFSVAGSRPGGHWFVKALWVAAPAEPGPILVRGGRIDAPGDLRFGPGSEPARELRLPIHSYEHTLGQPPGWRIFNAYLRPSSPGCYGMQLDTLAESRSVVVEVTR